MFEHGKTKQKYYSVREKINYYQNILNGKIVNVSNSVKRKAPLRLKSLRKINQNVYDEPTLIVTNDKHFGNKISKPRLSVVIDKDSKGRLLIVNTEHTKTKSIILDKNPTFQIGNKKKWIDLSEVYETKYIKGIKNLTKFDKDKISKLLVKK